MTNDLLKPLAAKTPEEMLIEYMRKSAYELYKIDWLRRISTNRQMDTYRDYIEEYILGYVDDGVFCPFEEALSEYGYNGELYSCFEEFLDNEYKDEDCMRTLFGNNTIFDAYKRFDPEFGV